MQNEITELRNQVRTLKRIVCLVCCLFAVFMFMGCSSHEEIPQPPNTWPTYPGTSPDGTPSGPVGGGNGRSER